MPTRSKRPHIDVMVSSTSRDLPDHRDAVIDAILRMDMFPQVMETGTASPTTAIRFSLELVDDAEVYIGIFGYRYGYRPADATRNPDTLSITELEYRHAVKRGIPILIFIMDAAHPVPVNAGEAEQFFEQDPESKVMLKRLKAELEKDYVVAYFKSPDDLKAKALHALQELCAKRIINCEGEEIAPDKSALPTPPAPYVAHPYILTRQFVGRRAELAELDAWSDSTDTTLIVDAIGGIGKSALTWEWFHHSDRAKTYAARFWWSFYESDSAVTNFSRHALAYLTGKPVSVYDGTSADERERELLLLLGQKRCLLVLDGLERILTAYHRMDAPHLLDENVESPHPAAGGSKPPASEEGGEATPHPVQPAVGSPSPSGRGGSDDPGALRRCIDPRHAELLKKLTTCAPSKVLISTRLIPADLQDASTKLMPNVREKHLNGLADSDALALLQHLGVSGDGAAMVRFTRQFDNHSLLLGILAGKINEYDPAPGDFDRWYADEGRELKLSEIDLKQRRTNILAYALDGLPAEQRKLLGQIAAFRYPVDYPTVSAFNPYLPPRPVEVEEPDEWYLGYLRGELNDADSDELEADLREQIAAEEAELAPLQAAYAAYQQALAAYPKPDSPEVREGERRFRTALRTLEGRGLLQRDKGVYDLHPVVRAFAFEGLVGDERRGTYERIRSHFEALPPEPLDEVNEIADLRRPLEIYYALVNADQLDLAARFYGDRLSDVLLYQLAAYPLMLELLTPLFKDGLDQPPALADTARQSARMTDMANALKYIGRGDEARRIEARMIGLDAERKVAADVGVDLRNYASSLHQESRLARALRACELARDLAEAARDEDGLAMSHWALLDSYRATGAWADGERAYQAFTASPPRRNTDYWQQAAEQYYAEMQFYQGLDAAAAALERAWELCVKGRNTLGQLNLHGLRGEVALRAGDAARAIGHFNDAITMKQKSGMSFQRERGGLARAYALLGRGDEARWMIAEGVNSIDAAEAYLTLGDKDKAGERAIAAYKWAWADGEPYVWRWELERAKTVLAALGIPVPDMPPFDPDKVEPIPHEAEIRAWIEELKAQKK